MATSASIHVVTEDGTRAAEGYTLYDGQETIDGLLDLAHRRNQANAWQHGANADEAWPVTPAEFITRWADARVAELTAAGRTGSSISTRTQGVSPEVNYCSEYGHLVVVNDTQVVSIRRILNARYGQGSSYTITFDEAPVTASEADTALVPRPRLFPAS